MIDNGCKGVFNFTPGDTFKGDNKLLLLLLTDGMLGKGVTGIKSFFPSLEEDQIASLEKPVLSKDLNLPFS